MFWILIKSRNIYFYVILITVLNCYMFLFIQFSLRCLEFAGSEIVFKKNCYHKHIVVIHVVLRSRFFKTFFYNSYCHINGHRSLEIVYLFHCQLPACHERGGEKWLCYILLLPFNHCINWTWVFEEILVYGIRLRATHCREFHYLKLYKTAYLFRTTQLLHHPGYSVVAGFA